jgi:hypothetical protein
MGAQLVELADALDPSQLRHPSGEARSPSRPTIGAIEIFDPFTGGAGCGASIALKRSRLGCD